MEIRDVLDTLEGFRSGIEQTVKNGRKVSFSTFFALDTIIRALHKEIPKKPIHVWNEETEAEYLGCPSCSVAIPRSVPMPTPINSSGNNIDNNEKIPVDYCPVCGKRLDWKSL